MLEIKAMKELQELLKSMKLSRRHIINIDLEGNIPIENFRQIIGSIRKMEIGDMGLLDEDIIIYIRMISNL